MRASTYPRVNEYPTGAIEFIVGQKVSLFHQ